MRGLLIATVTLLAVLSAALAACGGPAGPDHEESTTPTPTASRPAPTSATSETGDLVVCAQVAPLIARINGSFNTLSAGASQQRRTSVARAFERAHSQIRTIVERAGLTHQDQVRLRTLAVVTETARVARLLRSGAAVGNAGLQSAQQQLGVACKK